VENSIFFWRFQKIIWGFFYGLTDIQKSVKDFECVILKVKPEGSMATRFFPFARGSGAE